MLMTSCFVCATLNLGRKKSTGPWVKVMTLPSVMDNKCVKYIIRIQLCSEEL